MDILDALYVFLHLVELLISLVKSLERSDLFGWYTYLYALLYYQFLCLSKILISAIWTHPLEFKIFWTAFVDNFENKRSVDVNCKVWRQSVWFDKLVQVINLLTYFISWMSTDLKNIANFSIDLWKHLYIVLFGTIFWSGFLEVRKRAIKSNQSRL